MSLASIVATAVEAKLAEGSRCHPSEIAFGIQRDHADALVEDQERLIRDALHRQVKKHLAALADTDQPTLPGLGLPSAIYVPDPEGAYYVPAAHATWPELLAGRGPKVENITAAKARLDDYDRTLAALQPVMANNPGLTVTEAVAVLRKASA